jgi:hypothetical protein
VIAGTDVRRVEDWAERFSAAEAERAGRELEVEQAEEQRAAARVTAALPQPTGLGDEKEFRRSERELTRHATRLAEMKKQAISGTARQQYYQQQYAPAWRQYEEQFTRRYGVGPETYEQKRQMATSLMGEYERERSEAVSAQKKYMALLGPLAVREGEYVVPTSGPRRGQVIPTRPYYERVEAQLKPYIQKTGVMYPAFPASVIHTTLSVVGAEPKPRDVELVYRGVEEKLRPLPQAYFGETYQAATRAEEAFKEPGPARMVAAEAGPAVAALGHIGSRIGGTFESTYQFGERLLGGRPGRKSPPTFISGIIGPSEVELETRPERRFVTSLAAGAIVVPLEFKAYGAVSGVVGRVGRRVAMAVARAPVKALTRVAPPAVKGRLLVSTRMTRFLGTARPTKLVSPLVPESAERVEAVRGITGAVSKDIRAVTEKYIGAGPRWMGRTPFRQFYGVIRRVPGFREGGRLGGVPYKLSVQMEAPVAKTVGALKMFRGGIGARKLGQVGGRLVVEPAKSFFIPFGKKIIGKRFVGRATAKVKTMARKLPTTKKGIDIPGFPRGARLTAPKGIESAGKRLVQYMERKVLRPTQWRVRVPKEFETMDKSLLGKVRGGKIGDIKLFEVLEKGKKGEYIQTTGAAGPPPFADPTE